MKNKVIPLKNEDWANRRKEEQILRWLLGLEKESGLFRAEDMPEIPIIEIDIHPNEKTNKTMRL